MRFLTSKKIILTLTLIIGVSFGLNTQAAIPTNLNYQGYLTNSSNTPQSGTYAVTIRIYDALTSGTLLYEEIHPSITVSNGFITIPIGNIGDVNGTTTASSLDQLPFDNQYFVSVEIPSLSTGEMSPRTPINTVAFSYTAYGLIAQSAQPSNPNKGQLFFDTDDNSIYMYNGSAWNVLGLNAGVASDSIDFDELEDTLNLDANTSINGGAFSLTFDHASVSGKLNSSFLTVSGFASASGNLEVAFRASTSRLFVGGQTVRFLSSNTIDFDEIVASGTLANNLDINTLTYTLSLNTSNLILSPTSLQIGTRATISAPLEVTGTYASVSDLFIAGQRIRAITSNSIDFDELVASSTLDTNLDMALNGNQIDFGSGDLIITSSQLISNNSASISSSLEVTGYASVSDLFIAGQRIRAITSNSIDFDEIRASLSLDTNTYIDAGSYALIIDHASLSNTLESATLKVSTITSDNQLINITSNASSSANLEILGYASSSRIYGAGLLTCSGSNFLQYNQSTGKFNCTSAPTAASIVTREGYSGSFTTVSSLSFSSNAFNLNFNSFHASLSLDYINGPASRTIDQIISGHWTFNAPTSISSNLETTGNLKISGLGNRLYFPDGTFMTTAASVAAGVSNATDVNIIADNDTNGTGAIILSTNGSTRMTITSSGSIGIGDTTPEALFEVAGTASVQSLTINGSAPKFIESNSIDFDELKNSLTLDADTTITTGIYSLTFDKASISNLLEGSSLKLSSFASISSNLEVTGYASFSNLFVNGSHIKQVTSNSIDFDELVASSTLDTNLDIALNGNQIDFGSGDLIITSSQLISNNSASISSSLEVTGYASVSDLFIAGQRLRRLTSNSIDFDEIVASSTLDTNLDIALNGKQIDFSSGKLLISQSNISISNPTSISANLTITGNTTLGSSSSNFTLLKNQTQLRFQELSVNGNNYVGFKASNSIASNLIWTLPSAEGTSGAVLTTDGAGKLRWAAVAGSNPDTSIIDNTASAYTVSESTNKYLTITTTNGSEKLSFGNSSNNPKFIFNGLNGKILPDVSASKSSESRTTTAVPNSAFRTSMAIGIDGKPMIAYTGTTPTLNLTVAKCANVACTAMSSTIVVDSGTNLGDYPAMVILGDGTPAILYQDFPNYDVKYVKCGNSACTSGNTITIANNGSFITPSQINAVVGADGNVIFAFFSSNFKINIVQCTNLDCSSTNPVQQFAGIDAIGLSMDLGVDGNPILSYYDNNTDNIVVMKCFDSQCIFTPTITNLVSITNTLGVNPDIKVMPDGLPVVAYYDADVGGLKLIKCGNDACSSGNTSSTISTGFNNGELPSIAVGNNNFPLIASRRVGGVEVVACGDPSCSAFNIATIVNTNDNFYASLVKGSDGNPVMSYYNVINSVVNITRCVDPTCALASVANYSAGANGIDIGSPTQFFRKIYGANIFGKSVNISFFDLAETYPTKDTALEPGDIVMLDKDNPVFITKANKQNKNRMLGVVSTNPGLLLGGHDPEEFKEELTQPVALKGRIPVKVSNAEDIQIGDKLTLSEISGTARKAKQGEETIGYALTNKIENNKILMFVQNDTNSFSNELITNQEDLQSQDQDTKSALEYLSDKLTSQLLISTEFFTKRLTAMVGVFDIFKTQIIRVENGIEQKNPETGNVECYFIENGEWQKNDGSCENPLGLPVVQQISPSPTLEITPAQTPSMTPELEISPAIEQEAQPDTTQTPESTEIPESTALPEITQMPEI